MFKNVIVLKDLPQRTENIPVHGWNRVLSLVLLIVTKLSPKNMVIYMVIWSEVHELWQK